MRYSYLKRWVFLSAVILVSLFRGVHTTHALTISPARLELTGDPGTTISSQFLVLNEQGSTQTFYTSANNFESSGETGTPNFTTSKDGLASWIQLPPEVTLKKGEEQKIPFSIRIPKDADPGGYFAAIFLSTVPPVAESGQVSVGAKIGVLVLLRISGEIKEGGGILGFDTKDTRSFYASLPVDFVYRFNNSGSDRVNPSGTVTVRNTVGMTTATLPANSSQGNILPGSTRRFEVVWGSSVSQPSGFFAAAAYELHNFAFGMYRVNLNLVYGSNGSASASKTIFIFPWQLILIILILLAILWFILKVGIGRYNRWIISKASSQGKVA